MTDRAAVQADEDAIWSLSQRWVDAVGASDVDQLGRLIMDDVLVIHGNGRVLAGREAVLSDFVSGFSRLRMRQVLQREETVVAGTWAFERARVHTTITMLADGATRELDSHTITILRKSEAGEWRIARVIGVVEQQ
jgi:uncharacterized protein (TIGR02246 family)